MNFLKLIRYKNLLIITLTQYLMRWCVVSPILKLKGLELQFSELNFFLMVLSTVLIAAAGYAINDYFDRKTDMLNRPETVVVGNSISRRYAMLIHSLFNVLGVGLGVYLGYQVGILKIGFIYLIITGLLWFYSTTFKGQAFTGNLIVAALIAIVPFFVLLFELAMLNQVYGNQMLEFKHDINNIILWVTGFAYFAFLINLVREIIKDIEDVRGDLRYGRRTLPITIGVKSSKMIILSLLGVVVVSLLMMYHLFLSNVWYFYNDHITLWYFILFLILPCLYLGYVIIRAKEIKKYHLASNISKLIMLFGLVYAVISNFIISQNI